MSRVLERSNPRKAKELAVLALKKTFDDAGAAFAETWFVYVLRCADGSLYTGITTDVSRRCERHNAGTASRYTRSRLPVSVQYQEAQPTRSLALKREAVIKAMSRPEKESLIRFVG
jgi:predicted GIY-YIG superfamily endonuclease